MKIPIATYADVSRRIDTIGLFVCLGTMTIGMLILVLVAVPFADAVRDFAGGNVGVMLAMAISIPFLCLPLYLPIIVIRIIDRRVGIRCPNCNVSLTMGSLSEKILITRKCSNCLSVVLTNEDYSLAPQPYRPWVIVPLLVILLLLIVCFVARDLSSPDSILSRRTHWIENGIYLLAFLAIAKVHTMILNVMKRRWETEAAADESEQPR